MEGSCSSGGNWYSVGQMLACLEMLSQFYNVPFRRDVIERAVKESMKGRNIDLETLGI